jgi:hypothetical protein
MYCGCKWVNSGFAQRASRDDPSFHSGQIYLRVIVTIRGAGRGRPAQSPSDGKNQISIIRIMPGADSIKVSPNIS